MPNPGGPYGGCNACRRRKVKCDQTYPACRRCIKRGNVCPGVPDIRMQIFRDETSKTTVRVEAARERSSRRQVVKLQTGAKTANQHRPSDSKIITLEDSSAIHTTGESLIATSSDQYEQQRSLSRHPLGPLGDVLVTFFFDQITCPDIGWYAHLPHVYRNTPKDSHLDASIQAASLFALANQHHIHSPLLAQARSSYGRALTALNAALDNESERLKDEVLCTVLIFNVIDDITGNRDISGSAHLSGLQRVLSLRKSRGIKTLFGAEIWHSLAVKLQLLILRAGNKARYNIKILMPDMLGTPALTTHETYEAVCNFINSAKEILAKPLTGFYETNSLLSLLRQGKDIDLALQTWNQENEEILLGSRWQRHTIPAILEPTSQANTEYFNNVQAAKMWNQHRCARILLQQSVVDLAGYMLSRDCSLLNAQMRSNLELNLAESMNTIKEMLDHICASIPFNLHRVNAEGNICVDQSQRVVGGAGLVWPLEVILSCPYSSAMQRELAAETLHEIGYRIGVRQALTVTGD